MSSPRTSETTSAQSVAPGRGTRRGTRRGTQRRTRLGLAMGLPLATLWGWQIQLFIGGQLSLHDTFVGATITLAALIAVLSWNTDTVPVNTTRRRLTTAAVVAALTAIGAATRGLYLDQFPPVDGQLWEEAQMGQIGAATIARGSLDYFFPIPNLIAEAGFRLFGVSMHGLRLAFVTVGTASVAVFFIAARSLGLSTVTASLVTALFASSAYLSATSRIALETFSPVLTLCIALAASFRAARAPIPISVVLAGFTGGLLMTEYTSFKLYPPLLLATIALATWRDPHLAPPRGPRTAAYVALYLAGAGAVLLPILLVPYGSPLYSLGEGVLRHHNDMAATATDWSTWWGDAVGRVASSASYVFARGSTNGVLPESAGVLDRYTGSIALVALFYCATLARRAPRSLFLTAAILSTVVLAGLLTQNPARYRLAPLPPLCLLAIGLAIDAVRARSPGAWATAGAVTLTAGLCAVNVHLLFGVAMSDPLVLAEFGDRRIAVAHEIARLQRDNRGPVLLATRETYMGVANDFSFLYDLDDIETVDLDGGAVATRGTLIVDIEDAERARNLPTTSDCVEKRYRYGAHTVEFLVCRNGEPGSRR